MQEVKNKIEAVLFITGRFMSLAEIGDFSGIASPGIVKDALTELMKTHNERESALQIIEEKGNYKLNIRKQYNYLTTQLVSGCEMDPPTQASLALIAYKQPVLQAEIIKMRGNTAYDHIKALKEMDLVLSEKHGRTRMLKLAPKFYDYFDIVENVLQEKLKQTEEKIIDKNMHDKYKDEEVVEEKEAIEEEDWGKSVEKSSKQ